MAVLNDLQALFTQCPVLREFAPRTDQLETDAEGYSILPTGTKELTRDMTGAVTRQYNFVIAATRMSADDVMRLDNCNFMERVQEWGEEQNRKGVPLTDAEFISITASDGGLSEWDENYQYGVYKIVGALIYEKE